MFYYTNRTYYLEVSIIDRKGDFVSGQTITYTVYKSIDNSIFQSGTLTEVGTSGIYQTSIQFTSVGQYRVEYVTPISYENKIETFIVEENLHDLVKRILGLSQENYRLFSPTYDANNNLTSVTVKIYSTATDCENDTNILAQYSMTATYNANDELQTYKMVKV